MQPNSIVAQSETEGKGQIKDLPVLRIRVQRILEVFALIEQHRPDLGLELGDVAEALVAPAGLMEMSDDELEEYGDMLLNGAPEEIAVDFLGSREWKAMSDGSVALMGAGEHTKVVRYRETERAGRFRTEPAANWAALEEAAKRAVQAQIGNLPQVGAFMCPPEVAAAAVWN